MAAAATQGEEHGRDRSGTTARLVGANHGKSEWAAGAHATEAASFGWGSA